MRAAALAIVVSVGSGAAVAAPDPVALAARIDHHLAARWDAEKVRPAEPADDATFVRRVYLDLVGRIPTAAEVLTFVSNTSPDKRAELVARLVDSAAHARHAALFWRREWIPQTETPRFAELADQLDGWLTGQIRDGVPYDRIARALLTASRGKTAPGTRPVGDARPVTFLAASEYKPEELASNATRAFLGVNLGCAQCHNHPFARWTRDQFWQTAAFFATPAAGVDGARRFRLTVPGTDQVMTPKVLDGPEPTWPATPDADAGQAVFSAWVTAKDNPYFARNAVNRVWANLFGTGLVEPLDDLSGQNPPSHPELLDELTREFAGGGFDVKSLTRAIVLSRAYQLASATPAGGRVPSPQLFARTAARGLTGEQLYDSLRIAAGVPAERDDLDPLNAQRERKRFAEKFRIDRGGTAQRSILQSLSLMNGGLTAGLTDPATTPTLRAVADAPFLDGRGKIDALFLAALGRKPTSDEAAPLVAYIDRGGADRDAKKALADVFWALLLSSEFGTNH